MSTDTKQVPAAKANETLNFNLGTILHSINADKYTSEVKEAYVFECTDTGSKYRAKLSSMLVLAEADKTQDTFSLLIREGFEGSGKYSSGAGIAVKMTKTDDSYNCTFYEGEVGKQFDPKKVQSRTYIAIDRKHLGALFIYLRCNEEVAKAKVEALKVQRSTLDLG